MSELKRVHEWNIVAGNARKPDTGLFILYMDLIEEELAELKAADTREDILDALSDLIIVATGAIHAMGVDADTLLKRVNDANFSKFDTTEEDAELSVFNYGLDTRYYNVRYEKVGGFYVIRGDKVNGGKNKILKSHKWSEPVLADI